MSHRKQVRKLTGNREWPALIPVATIAIFLMGLLCPLCVLTASAGLGEVFIESVSPVSPYPGQSVYLDGFGFGDGPDIGQVFIDGDDSAVITHWSNELIVFTLPLLPGVSDAIIEVLVEPAPISNGVIIHPKYPTSVTFMNLMPGHVASGAELAVSVAPEYDNGQVELVSFFYRGIDTGLWTPFATDEDGQGPRAGTSSWVGEGDGWAATLLLDGLDEGVYELRAEAVDLHGQFMEGEFTFLYDPTPLAPHILLEESEQGATIADADEIKIEMEMTDAQVESLISAILPINWHKQRELKKVDQDTLKVIDEDGVDISGWACGPAAAASCLTWFRDRFPELDKDPAELARKIAKAAGTEVGGTGTDGMIAGIIAILKECGLDPEDWGVSYEGRAKQVYRDMVQGLNKEGTDKIPLIYQKSTEDINGDGIVDDKDVTGHFVTMSSRGSRYRDYMFPPTTHLIAIERFIDFFNPATGETEEYRIDDTKTPPELIGYEMNGTSAGNAWIEGVICVRPPASPNRMAGAWGCDWGHPLDLPVFESTPVAGPGPVTWQKTANALPFGPGPALLGLFAKDSNGCVSGELYSEILVAGFAELAFTASPVSGSVPLDVEFSNMTTPTDSVIGWEWDFNDDGVIDSVDEHPVFTYTAPGTYSVSLRAENPHGSDHLVVKDFVEALDPTSSTGPQSFPLVTQLFPVSPNPVGSQARLRFELSTPGDVRFEVYDVRGRAIWRGYRSAVEAGVHEMLWNTEDGGGRAVSSGVYFVKMHTSTGVERWQTIRVLR